MASHVPFVHTIEDCRQLRAHYLDSKIIRISLEAAATVARHLPREERVGRWLDPGFDGYHKTVSGKKGSIPDYIRTFDTDNVMGNAELLRRPQIDAVRPVVDRALGACMKLAPSWLTVPQLPVIDDTSRNQLNCTLARATHDWKSRCEFRGLFVLPLIFTHKDQLKGRTQWGPKLEVVKKCYHEATANAVWVVDSTLDDKEWHDPFRKRFDALIRFHQDLKDKLPPKTTVVAGPYWGMNLVLWARGLCDYPAVSLGSGYRYYLAGGFHQAGKVRVALPPLRRCAITAQPLRAWLERALQDLDPDDRAFKEFANLRDRFDLLMNRDAARDQVAGSYKVWFDKIASVPAAGRALALYQDLSSAYVLGKHLKSLPRSGQATLRPEKVAEHLMLSCL
ncbi:MAG TPA: hypothetical protein VMZ31_10245 [Phycisphaerae bacterium]|nr:hypothetical protein [Phycisphaerae bacterium]